MKKITMREHMINSKRVNIIHSISKNLITKSNILCINNLEMCGKSRYSFFDGGDILKSNPKSFTNEFLEQELEFVKLDFYDIKSKHWSHDWHEYAGKNILVTNVPDNDRYFIRG